MAITLDGDGILVDETGTRLDCDFCMEPAEHIIRNCYSMRGVSSDGEFYLCDLHNTKLEDNEGWG